MMSTHFVESLRGKLNLNAIAFRFQKAQIVDSSPLLETGECLHTTAVVRATPLCGVWVFVLR
jgi:hypothetical protein